MSTKERRKLQAIGTVLLCSVLLTVLGATFVEGEGRLYVAFFALLAGMLAGDFVERRTPWPQIRHQLLLIGGMLLATAALWAAAVAFVPALRSPELRVVTILAGLLAALIAKHALRDKLRYGGPSRDDDADANPDDVLRGAMIEIINIRRLDRPPLQEWLPLLRKRDPRFHETVVPVMETFDHFEAEIRVAPEEGSRAQEWMPEMLDATATAPPPAPGIDADVWEEALDYATAWSWQVRTGGTWRTCVEDAQETSVGPQVVRVRFAVPAGVRRMRLFYVCGPDLAEFDLPTSASPAEPPPEQAPQREDSRRGRDA